MNKRKLDKIESKLLIAIQYARLQNDLNFIKTKNAGKTDTKLQEIMGEIKQIEETYSPQVFNLYNSEKFTKLVELLSSNKNGLIYKYKITIKIILDNNYNDKEAFLSDLSVKLFNDAKEIDAIEKEFNEISKKIAGVDVASKHNWGTILMGGILTVGAVACVASRVKSKRFFLPFTKFAKKVVGKCKIGGQMVQPSTSGSVKIAKLSKIAGLFMRCSKMALKLTIKKKDITNNEFAFGLCICALCLSRTKRQMGEIEYYKYYKLQLKFINNIREKISKELFVKWYDKENNYNNLLLLQKFDEIAYKLIKAKGGK